MARKVINKEILDSIKKFTEKAKECYNIEEVILFGSYAKGTQNKDSDIDIAVVSKEFKDIYDCMSKLMGMTWEIDARIQPHPIKKEDFDNISSYFIKEIKDTGIKVV